MGEGESEGLSWPGFGTAARMVGRALILRCPNCGGGPVLKDWFHLRTHCPTCGIALERGEESDYYIGGMLLAGRTIGQAVMGLRIIRVDRTAAVNPWRAVLRTALLMLLIPAIVVDRDGRGFHDRLTDTCVINA